MDEWRWCSDSLNPADDGTRAKIPSQFEPNDRWIMGPEFLRSPDKLWPPFSNPGEESYAAIAESYMHRVYRKMPEPQYF